MTPEVYEAIKAELRYQLPVQVQGHAKRNRGKAKRQFLSRLAKQSAGTIDWFVRMCQYDCDSVTADDVAQVAQSTLDKWSTGNDWMAEAMAMQAEYADERDTQRTLLAY